MTDADNVGQLIANTRKLKGSTGYGASGTDLIAQLSSIRGLPNMSFSSGKLYNAWSGQVTVVANGMTFTVTEAGLPQDACVTLATKIGRGQKVTTSINGGTAVNGEVSSAAATSGCSTDIVQPRRADVRVPQPDLHLGNVRVMLQRVGRCRGPQAVDA
ncbi:hypothetical protein ALQ92_200167 [Pseudomonas syringae pv. pisi]|uniref:Type 4 secretion system PilS N-terminal domain-containing protein n=1 Tax=Pseudomonas savastanoi pv. phaseolicola TaxID=319 RepID=A0A7Z6Y5M0_PSESH|nr:hypothetical protein ALQ92_200167 [Pseudomonas syringae pv. pisi]RMU81225.1 hypothetical protein ALP21_200376 [Pseudomonas savastanoi pv. phaseolicola]